jgi:hypothetical protein
MYSRGRSPTDGLLRRRACSKREAEQLRQEAPAGRRKAQPVENLLICPLDDRIAFLGGRLKVGSTNSSG